MPLPSVGAKFFSPPVGGNAHHSSPETWAARPKRCAAIHAFEQKGVDCLNQESSRPKTVQAQFDQARCEELRAILHKPPRVFGKVTSLWTLQLAAEVCFEQGLTEQQISIETIRQALKRLGQGNCI